MGWRLNLGQEHCHPIEFSCDLYEAAIPLAHPLAWAPSPRRSSWHDTCHLHWGKVDRYHCESLDCSQPRSTRTQVPPSCSHRSSHHRTDGRLDIRSVHRKQNELGWPSIWLWHARVWLNGREQRLSDLRCRFLQHSECTPNLIEWYSSLTSK